MTKLSLKHNKKRNPAFVYEALVREIVGCVIKENQTRKPVLLNIIRTAYAYGTELNKELSIYKSISESQGVSKEVAEKILTETKLQHNKLNKKKLSKEKSFLIDNINKKIGKHVFLNFVPNYKTLASIFQIFNSGANVKQSVLFEQQLVEFMIDPNNAEKVMEPVDNLVVKSFITRYNEEYDDKLNRRQKNLMREYILSFEDDGLSLKSYLNEEVSKLKKELKFSLTLRELKEDTEMSQKTNEIISLLENYKNQNIDRDMIVKLLKVQNLLEELKSDEAEIN